MENLFITLKNIGMILCAFQSVDVVTKFLRRYCTFVPPIIIGDSSWKNTAESFAVALTLTLGGYQSAIAPFLLTIPVDAE